MLVVNKLAHPLVSAIKNCRKGIEFKILDIDNGIGIFRLTGEEIIFPDLSQELSKQNFKYFLAHLDHLPVVDWDELYQWVVHDEKTHKEKAKQQ